MLTKINRNLYASLMVAAFTNLSAAAHTYGLRSVMTRAHRRELSPLTPTTERLAQHIKAGSKGGTAAAKRAATKARNQRRHRAHTR
jgi:hypothetical protein